MLVQNNFSTLKTDPLRNFKFRVIIGHRTNDLSPDQLRTFGFTSVSGLSMTTESIPYRQGGYNTTVHQIPGQTTFSPITLQRGVLINTHGAWDWMRELFSTIAGNGLGRAGNNFRAPVEIHVLDHPVTQDTDGSNNNTGVNVAEKMKFKLYNAWISSLSYSDLNAGDNSLLVEQMTLVHEGFDVKWATTTPGESAPNFAV